MSQGNETIYSKRMSLKRATKKSFQHNKYFKTVYKTKKHAEVHFPHSWLKITLMMLHFGNKNPLLSQQIYQQYPKKNKTKKFQISV